jgi:UDP-glucose 4-epimerase
MATVLITGGTGFIGSYVAQDFVNAGHDVVAFDLSTDTHILEKLDIASEVTVRRGDVSDPTDLLRAVRETGTTHIVHLAALLTTSARESPRLAHEVNIGGTNTVFEAARILDDQIERVAWASSAAVFAPPANYDNDWVTEDDLVYPDTLYGATKEYNEHQARVYYEDHEISHVGLRPTVAYGPYRETGGSAFLANIIEKPALGESFSVEYGDQVIDWQHVKDIAQAFRLATLTADDQLSQRIYNVRGEIATIRKASETVQSILPDAELTVSDEGELPWTQQLDMSAIQDDMGYDVEYDLERGFREYINVLREENGLETV